MVILAPIVQLGWATASAGGGRVLYRIRGGHVRRLLEEALFQADHLLTGRGQAARAARIISAWADPYLT